MNPLPSHLNRPKHLLWQALYQGDSIWVSLILDFLANGMTIDELLAEYPQLAVKMSRRHCLWR